MKGLIDGALPTFLAGLPVEGVDGFLAVHRVEVDDEPARHDGGCEAGAGLDVPNGFRGFGQLIEPGPGGVAITV
jgi:hypothetical protein